MRLWNIRKIRTGVGVLAVLAGMGVGVHAARAGIAVAPLKQEISLHPGEAGEVTVSLAYNRRSDADPPEPLHLSAMDVVVAEDGAISFKRGGLVQKSASPWISFEHDALTLAPGGTVNMTCKVTPPLNTPPGEYYTAVIVTLDTPVKNPQGVVVRYRIASGVFVTILGRTLPKRAEISRCELLWPSAKQEQAATQPAGEKEEKEDETADLPRVSVLLQNTGEARFDGSGKVLILDDALRPVFSGALTSKRACVFGGDSRLFEAPITKMLAPGWYRIRVEMDYQSAWAKARTELPIQILPEQAEELQKLQARSPGDAHLVELAGEKIAGTLEPGAVRTMAMDIKNVVDGPVMCSFGGSGEKSESDSWISLGQEGFPIGRKGHHAMTLRVAVPADARPGSYTSTLLVQAKSETGVVSKVVLPVEIEVKGAR